MIVSLGLERDLPLEEVLVVVQKKNRDLWCTEHLLFIKLYIKTYSFDVRNSFDTPF